MTDPRYPLTPEQRDIKSRETRLRRHAQWQNRSLTKARGLKSWFLSNPPKEFATLDEVETELENSGSPQAADSRSVTGSPKAHVPGSN
jgi:hypothetical protein